MSDYNWAMVEMYRWEHGELPDKTQKEITVPGAFRGGAELMMENPPPPMSVASVLNMVADWWEDLAGIINDAKKQVDEGADLEDIKETLKRWNTSLPPFDSEDEIRIKESTQ